MESQYYIRIRGTVRGPFPPEKLIDLARRGQFSRLYHVSVDGQNWEPAAKHPELLPKARAVKIRKQTPESVGEVEDGYQLADPDDNSGNAGQSLPMAEPDPGFSDAPWFYAHAGEEFGPCSFEELRLLASRGELQYNDVVWSEGMDDWIEAFSVRGLIPEGEFADIPSVTEDHAFEGREADSNPGAIGSTPIASMAIASIVAGVLGFTVCLFLGSIGAVVCGHMALREISASQGTLAGRGLAITGLVMGYAAIGICLLSLIITIVVAAFGAMFG